MKEITKKELLEIIGFSHSHIVGDRPRSAFKDVGLTPNTFRRYPGPTTDQKSKQAHQNLDGIGFMTGYQSHHTPARGGIFYMAGNVSEDSEKEKVDESNMIEEDMMKKMVEDMMTKRLERGFSEKVDGETGMLEPVPRIDAIRHDFEKPILHKKVSFLGELLSKEDLTNDEKIIIINHLIGSMGAIEVPAKYEKEFKSKLYINGK